MHAHLDLLGGLSGDMFIGALLDCFPDAAAPLDEALVAAGFQDLVSLATTPFDDGILTGTRFKVSAASDSDGHHHRHYSEIRDIINRSSLPHATREHALGIFEHIAIVEARIHGKTVDEVAFHEVGAWDSIADTICAAHLIATLPIDRWSLSSIPTGRGTVMTAHGRLPVPAPATARLLEGFICHDDGIEGERVTPTGAAIIRHLQPTQEPGPAGRLVQSGYGFGTRKLPGTSNVARLMLFDEMSGGEADEVLCVEFEIDDQTQEDLAVGLENLRQIEGVLDVSQGSRIGKKGRQMAAVRVLAMPRCKDDVLRACFLETTTLGVRHQVLTRSILERAERQIESGGASATVKIVNRAGVATAKAEMDDIANVAAGHAGRQQIRQAIESTALEGDDADAAG